MTEQDKQSELFEQPVVLPEDVQEPQAVQSHVEQQQESEQSKVNEQRVSQATTEQPQVLPKCFVCGDELKDVCLYSHCLSDHRLCRNCTNENVQQILAEPHLFLPPKCLSSPCESAIDIISFESCFQNETILEQFRLACINVMLLDEMVDKETQVLVQCPLCNYCEIRDKCGLLFIFCQNEECKKRTCYYCHLECPYQACDDRSDTDHDYEDYEACKHFECAELHEIKDAIETAIEDGSTVKCPNCQLAGLKDENCAHMYCSRCSTNYCYICGLDEATCSKAIDSNNDLFGHNYYWESDAERCPQYLSLIFQIDSRWPEEDDELVSVEFFHRLRILQNLKQRVFDKYTIEEVKYVEAKYGILKKSQITFDEVLNTDTVIIKRAVMAKESEEAKIEVQLVEPQAHIEETQIEKPLEFGEQETQKELQEQPLVKLEETKIDQLPLELQEQCSVKEEEARVEEIVETKDQLKNQFEKGANKQLQEQGTEQINRPWQERCAVA